MLAFAQEELCMPSKGSYTLYSDLGSPHVVWVIHAARELSLEPKQWWYPFIGKQEYRGYFSEKDAMGEVRGLQEDGYETSVSGVDAYSTLGAFRDPLLNTFILRDEAEFAELLFHELAHQRHYAHGDTSYNEGLAEAVSREGVRRWLRAHGSREQIARYETRLKRLAQAGGAIQNTSARLKNLYRSNLSDTQKRARKQQEIQRLKDRLRQLRGEWGGGLDTWIDEPINNARINSFTAYENHVPQFQRLLEECGGDFATFWLELERKAGKR
jgi:predicted aminopeptidase